MATPAPYTGTATGFKKDLGWYSDTEVNAPTTPAPTIQQTMVGPIQPGTTRPTVNVPNPALTPAPPGPLQNGTLQGPYPVKDDNGQTTYQAGMNVVNGTMTPNAPPTPQMTSAPTVPTTPYASNWTTTPQQAQQSAAEQAAIRIKQLLAGGKSAYDTGTTSENNAFNYGNQVTQGNRSLRNATNYAKSDPFQGSTMENNFRIQREDGINDTYTNDQHQNKLNAISQTWQDLQTAAPEQQQALYDQLYQQAAALGMQADQLNLQAQNQNFNQGIAQAGVTGQYNGQQTLAAQQQAYNQDPNNPNNVGQTLNNQLTQLQLNDYPTQSQNQAKLVQQQLTAGDLSNKAAQYNFDQLKDPKSPMNQAAALDLQMKQIDASSYSQENKLKLQQLQKTIAEIGVVHYKPQTAAEIEMDKVQLETAKANLANIQNPKPPGNSTELNGELDGLYEGITSGQLTKADALAEIEDKVNAGLYTQSDAAQMKDLIGRVSSKAPNVLPAPSQNQIDALGGNPQDLNQAQLEKLWATDPTGKAAGTPSIDWGNWYVDPRGRLGGVPFKTWRIDYGPKLTK